MSKQDAKTVRNALRSELGANSKAVSVRTDRSTGSLYISIKDLNLSIEAVEAIGNRARRVSYCDATGEILSGGNTFVFVKYADDAVEAAALPLADTFSALAAGTVSRMRFPGVGVVRFYKEKGFFEVDFGGVGGAVGGRAICVAKYVVRALAKQAHAVAEA